MQQRLMDLAASAALGAAAAVVLPATAVFAIATILLIAAAIGRVRGQERGERDRWTRWALAAAIALVYVQTALWVGPLWALLAVAALAVVILASGGELG